MSQLHFDHPVLQYFQALSQVPRGSGNERGVSDWLMEFAAAHGLDADRDDALNVVLRKGATPGYENAPAVMLQGHMDMVCEKNAGVDHDFTRDPIRLIEDGEYLRADGTTLGADNGIGMAMMLAVLTDEALEHPALECLITTSEEVGMLGAKALDKDRFAFRSRTLINLDTGIMEGCFVVGCAGGGRVAVRLPVGWEQIPPAPLWSITVGGLRGGHSGAEIHLGRANANQVLGRILRDLEGVARPCSVSGGTKENLIPREARALVACADGAALAERCAAWQEILRREFRVSDPGVAVSAVPAGTARRVYDGVTARRLLSLLTLLPCGVQSMDQELGSVATSANLGAVSSGEAEILFTSSVRSSLPSHLEHLLLPRYEALAGLCGAAWEQHDFYPGWTFRSASRVRDLALECYREHGVKEPTYMTLHGGLECGLLMEALGEMDAISFAPEINSPHSPNENVRIPSVEVNYRVLTALLKRLC